MLSLFKKDLPSDLGELLLVSELKGEEMEESVEARAYRTGVMIGKVFMKYHFDLRFAVDENTLTIDYKDEELVWELPLRDSLKWRAVLR